MNGINLHRLRHKSVEEKAACPGGSPVEAEGELVEVVVEMLGADRALMWLCAWAGLNLMIYFYWPLIGLGPFGRY